MTLIFIIITLIIICILGIALGNITNKDKYEHERKIFNYSVPVTIEELTDEEYKKQVISLLKSNNINLIELQSQIDKQNKMIDDIKFCINLIAFMLFIPFVIKLIILIIKINQGIELYNLFF